MIGAVPQRSPETTPGGPDESNPARGSGVWRRTLVVMLVGVAVLLAVLGVLYIFGTPQSAPLSAPSAEASPAMGAATSAAKPDTGAEVKAGGQAPPADPNSPLALEIPGCVCHSEDPALVQSHSRYRMNQCAGCHVAGISMGR